MAKADQKSSFVSWSLFVFRQRVGYLLVLANFCIVYNTGGLNGSNIELDIYMLFFNTDVY